MNGEACTSAGVAQKKWCGKVGCCQGMSRLVGGAEWRVHTQHRTDAPGAGGQGWAARSVAMDHALLLPIPIDIAVFRLY